MKYTIGIDLGGTTMTAGLVDEDYNIAVRTGYHCAPLIHDHLEDKDYVGVVRASLGRYTTKDDVDRLIMAVEEIDEG